MKIPHDRFCVLPWISLEASPIGTVRPCCLADDELVDDSGNKFNLATAEFSQIQNSNSMRLLRQEFIDGKQPKTCRKCWREERAGRTSKRMHTLDRLKHMLPDQTWTADAKPLMFVDLKLGNICNLKCRMCSGYFSSAIAQEEKELFGSNVAVNSALRLQQRKSSLTEILEYLPFAENIYFAGGEPLLAAEHYAILNALIACGNTELAISYNTNFTTLTYQNISVLDIWKHFSNINIGASLDAIGPVAEYVRHGTKWITIESNLELVKTRCPHINFTVTSTVGLLNVSSLIDLQKTWHIDKILDLSKFSLSVMISPEHLIVSTLPIEHKKRLDTLIKNHIAWCQNEGNNKLADQWLDVLNYMWSEDHSHHLAEFKRLTTLFDVHRKELLAEIIPDLKALIDE